MNPDDELLLEFAKHVVSCPQCRVAGTNFCPKAEKMLEEIRRAEAA